MVDDDGDDDGDDSNDDDGDDAEAVKVRRLIIENLEKK